ETAELFRDRRAGEAHFHKPLPDILRISLVTIENAARHAHGAFVSKELADLLLQHFLVVGKIEIHDVSLDASIGLEVMRFSGAAATGTPCLARILPALRRDEKSQAFDAASAWHVAGLTGRVPCARAGVRRDFAACGRAASAMR